MADIMEEAVTEPANVEIRSRPTESHVYKKSKSVKTKVLVIAINFFLFATVPTCLVYSKLTIIHIFGELHLTVLSYYSSPIDPVSNDTNPEQVAATLYWMLLFIVLIPNIITLFRGLLNGVLSKSPQRPWPKITATVWCVIISIFETLAESFLFFYAFIALPPAMSVLLMCGVFRIESIFDLLSRICKTNRASCYKRKGTRSRTRYYEIVSGSPNFKNVNSFSPHSLQKTLAKRFCCLGVVIGLIIFQAGGIVGLCFCLYFAYHKNNLNMGSIVINLLIILGPLLLLSLTWFGGLYNKFIFKASSEKSIKMASDSEETLTRKNSVNVTARWKSSIIAATVRLLIYPFASYTIFRLSYQLQLGDEVDPWEHSTLAIAFQWTHRHIHVFAVHVITSLFGYILSWIACYMTLHVAGLLLPVIFATPLSLLIYFFSTISFDVNGDIFIMYPFHKPDRLHFTDWKDLLLSNFYIYAVGIASLLWIGQIIATLTLYKSKNAILASDKDMFVRPHYNSVLLEQSLIINRSVSPNKQGEKYSSQNQGPFKVYVCSTMFRETITEMKQMLHSIHRIAKHLKNEIEEQSKKGKECNYYESHIFFDGGCREDELSPFAVQLMSLIQDTLNVELENCTRIKTPYGNQFEWIIAGNMPFVVHLKDNLKVRNKKRWSQVMYMNYILNYRHKDYPESENPESNDLRNTFILTTDADIDFTAESADILLDLLAREPSVGAVCSRTRPLGSGPLYWYQVFDYAIGHWLQKSTEDVLGSVLCCPGCFSMFRCSALKDCLETYSSEVSDAMELLMKDMGEDRWLCTLLIENGWRLEYCANSYSSTYCPETFDEFYKQRRRWLPSSIANLWFLVTKCREITSNNKYVSWVFIAYLIIILFTTVISPATVILVIASVLQTAFGLNSTAVVITLSIVTLCYGIICIYTSQKTQLDVAKLLTFLFSIIMAVVNVVAGSIIDIVQNIFSSIDLQAYNVNNTNVNAIIQNKKLPVAETTLYASFFAVIFVVTGILHFGEGLALFQSLWYLLCLPSGYLLLLIYSAANLNDRSWGTREEKNTSEKSLVLILQEKARDIIFKIFKQSTKSSEITSKPLDELPLLVKEHVNGESESIHQEIDTCTVREDSLQEDLDKLEVQKWLKENESVHFLDNFVKEGYAKKQFIADMNEKDLEEIGVRPIGYRYHLLKAIKELPQTPIKIGLPESVESWIKDLDLDSPEDNYEFKFHENGYYGQRDVENLAHITRNEVIKDIGVTKRGHVKRFMKGIERLKIRNEDEKKIAKTEFMLQNIRSRSFGEFDDENVVKEEKEEKEFWSKLVTGCLKPIPDCLTQANKLRNDLKFLRNSTLLAIFLINLIWLILLSVLTFSHLNTIGPSANVLGFLFLAVYGVLITVQFIGMLLHRVVTFCHYFARLDRGIPLEMTRTQ